MMMLALASLASATTAAAAAPTALSTALDAATFYHNGTAHASDGEPHSPMGTSTPESKVRHQHGHQHPWAQLVRHGLTPPRALTLLPGRHHPLPDRRRPPRRQSTSTWT